MNYGELQKYRQDKCNEIPYKTCKDCNKSWETVEKCESDTT